MIAIACIAVWRVTLDLKEFIKATISAIAEATSELQEEFGKDGILINPPSAQSGATSTSQKAAIIQCVVFRESLLTLQ